jgi:dihydrodipicolinate synthase/N-acetylneuraminate lyase
MGENSMTWSGIFPATTTKFTEDGSLDIAEIERCLAIQIDAGVDGLIIGGSLGEGSMLELEEKIEVLKTAVNVAAGRIPILGTISEPSTAAGQQMAAAAEAAGADGLMVIPSTIYFTDRHESIANLRAIAAGSALPIMVYINPLAYRVDITPDMLEELADEPKLVAIKESSDDIRRTTEVINRVGDRYRIFTGVDNLALESLIMGAHGWVAGLVNAFPAETVAIYRLVRAGRIDEARAIYRWFRPLLDLDVNTKLVQNIKLAEALAIGSNDRVRMPRLALAGSERAEVEAIITKAMAERPVLPELENPKAA